MSDLFDQIYEVHSNNLVFDNRSTDGRLVAFSAVPGKFGYLRLANKDIRSIIKNLNLVDTVTVGDYTLWLLDKISAANSYNIVFDRNIDQWYNPLKLWTNQHKYRFITIGLEIDRIILDKRLIQREKSANADVFNVIKSYDTQHTAMYKQINRDIVFRNNYDLDEAARLIAKV
jgi:hypothetical protein